MKMLKQTRSDHDIAHMQSLIDKGLELTAQRLKTHARAMGHTLVVTRGGELMEVRVDE